MTALRTRSVTVGRRRLIELAAFGFGVGLSLSPLVPADAPPPPARDLAAAPAVHRDAGEDSRRSGRRTGTTAAVPAPVRVATAGGTTAISGIVAEPTKIAMPSIDTAVPLVRLGLNPDGTMEVPKDFQTAGWYLGAAKPGAPGRAVIAGHVDSYTGPAAFHRLGDLKRGDEIRISRSDGSTAVFEVVRLEQHPKDEFPTQRVYGPDREPLLRLVTCGGTFDEGDRSYLDNVIVFARAASGEPDEAPRGQTQVSGRRR